mgnify:CR=1 FL=1
MGILEGLFTGRAGIQAHGTAMAVLADNIANANTPTFKQSRADFSDLLAGSLGGAAASNAAGSGSQILHVTQILTQGTFEFTGRGLDVGIDGAGFFLVQDVGGSNARYYTRAGNFTTDSDGYLLNQNGFRVLGFPVNGAGGLESLNVNERSGGSIGTSSVTISGNLDASSATEAVPGGTPSFAELNNAAKFSTFLDVFDSLGGTHTVTTYFFHTASNTWEARSYVDGGQVIGGTLGEPFQVGSAAAMNFESDGSRTTTDPHPDITGSPPWNNGSSASPIEINLDPFTQFSASSAIQAISQDGTGGGRVTGFTVESNGNLFAQLDNGQTASIGIVALASFANPEGLQRAGASLYQTTSETGEPVVGRPDTGTLGSLKANSLELSTSDIAADFIKLISLQRGFQANSRIITTVNQLLNDNIQLA